MGANYPEKAVELLALGIFKAQLDNTTANVI